jgi:hypothetical protein
LKSEGTLIEIINTDGIKTENIQKYKKADIDGGYIIYDSLKYNVEVAENTTNLGESKSKDHSDGYKITVTNLNSSSTDINIKVLTKDYKKVIYQVDNGDIQSIDLRSYEWITLIPTYYGNINIDNSSHENKSVTIAFYNEETKEDTKSNESATK